MYEKDDDLKFFSDPFTEEQYEAFRTGDHVIGHGVTHELEHTEPEPVQENFNLDDFMPDAGVTLEYPFPINWWVLNDLERERLLVLLREWVKNFVYFYALPASYVPPCWDKHNHLIQELLAFAQYREQAMCIMDQRAGVMVDFHYHLQLLLSRLREWVALSGCNIREHRDSAPETWCIQREQVALPWRENLHQFIEEHYKNFYGRKTK